MIILLFRYNNKQCENTKNIKTLVRECARLAIASEQDISPLIALLHANTSAGYLWAIKDIYTSEQVKFFTGIDIMELQDKITKIQDKATKRVSVICPMFAKEILEHKDLAIYYS